MKFKKDFDSLVIVGNWNYSIFKPDWVSKYLLSGEKIINASFPLGGNASPQISGENVKIYAIGNKLSFQCLKYNPKTHELIEQLAIKTADYLPHTPVSAYGINFIFEQPVTEELKSIITLNDKSNINEEVYKLLSTTIIKRYQTESYQLNLTINLIGSVYSFDFNFHVNVKNLVDFKEKIDEEGILEYESKALGLMSEMYNLELDE